MFLSLPRLAEILEGSESSQRGIEKGEEVGDKDVVEEKRAVAVGVFSAQLCDEAFEGVEMLGTEDFLRPDGELTPRRFHRTGAFRPLGRWNRTRGSLLGRHERQSGQTPRQAQVKF